MYISSCLMEKQNILFFFYSSFFLLPLLSEIQSVQGSSHHHRHPTIHGFHPTKLIVFGDSYSDTGNTPKSNSSSWHVPYGITSPGKPTGRFSDGRILTDFLAKYFGLKSPVPYELRKNAPKLVKGGMNFAFGGTGVFDTGIPLPNMTLQTDFLQNLVTTSVYTKSDLRSSLCLVTVAGNDYSAYLSNGGSIQNLPSFIATVVNQLSVNLKRLQDMGLRRVAVAGLQPLGCLPGSTILNSFQLCNGTINALVKIHNTLLQQAVAKLNNETFIILDLYDAFSSVLQHKGNVNFETPLKPCCQGTGSGFSCGSIDEKGNKMYTICNNPKTAFFWDLFHPTQEGWRATFFALKSKLESS